MDTTNTRSADMFPHSRPAALGTRRRGSFRRAIVLALASIATLASSSVLTTAYAAEECYKDTAGRIVSRRRPGFVEVACPWVPFTFVGAGASATSQPEDADAKPRPKMTATQLSSGAPKSASLPRRT